MSKRPSCIPTATYRIQLHQEFTFADAAKIVPYLRGLGISHLYLSPVLKARAGSQHGYDVVDHSEINTELGGEPALRALAAVCHAEGLGIIVDIVPNHMAVGNENPYWQDVLARGAASQFAPMFDINFSPVDALLAGKVVLPVLGEPYGHVLESRDLQLVTHEGELAIAYGPHRFPLRQEAYAAILAGKAPNDADLSAWQDPVRLHALLEQQHFHLCWWRAAGDLINWRRFFDVNELAGLRVEDDTVFRRIHDVTIRLYGEGVFDGVRVDHIDGLAEPAAYAHKLREELTAMNHVRPADLPQDGPYIIVEKILGEGETLPADWHVDGTSGYDFMNEVNALQHDPAGEAALQILWHELRNGTGSFDDMESSARREVLRGGFAGQLADCARGLAALAQARLETRDLTEESFRRALVGLVARLRVYRSYATGRPNAPPPDPPFVEAFDAARASLPADDAAFEFLAEVLAGTCGGEDDACIAAVRRLNQLTAPVAAKAVEDTAFYRYGKLLSRNDVGFYAAQFSLDAESFIATGVARALAWPRAMLTTATHDHKRGEDVRARLAVLSELAELWCDTARYWLSVTALRRPEAVAPDDAYTLFQTLVGCWPIGLSADDAEGLAVLGQRVAGWRIKSLREAKRRSSWAAPDEAFEQANLEWLKYLLDPGESANFLHGVVDLVGRIVPAAAVNGVVQAALRCTWPGVPDLYQGAELWDLSLVDPDNRRPVDYVLRQHLLESHSQDWASGGVKQQLIANLLTQRRDNPDLFRDGALEAVETRGPRRGHVLAFRRVAADRWACVAVLLQVASAVVTLGEMPGIAWWGDTELNIENEWRLASDIFAHNPVFCCTGGSSSP